MLYSPFGLSFGLLGHIFLTEETAGCSSCVNNDASEMAHPSISRDIDEPSIEEVKAVAHMKHADAAQFLGVTESKLRKLSLKAGFKRWPARRLQSFQMHKKVFTYWSALSIDCNNNFNVRDALQHLCNRVNSVQTLTYLGYR